MIFKIANIFQNRNKIKCKKKQTALLWYCSGYRLNRCLYITTYPGRCSYESISHLIMRNNVGAITFKLLVLDINMKAPTLSLIVRWEMLSLNLYLNRFVYNWQNPSWFPYSRRVSPSTFYTPSSSDHRPPDHKPHIPFHVNPKFQTSSTQLGQH